LPPAPAPVLFLSILPPADGFDLSPDPVVSPDGKHIAFKAHDAYHPTHIWLKTLGASDASVIAGTEDTDYNFAPFWSPDSRSLAFFSRGRLKRVDITGGAASQVLAAAREPRGGTWMNDGRILFNGDTQNLFVVQASGAAPAAVVPGRAGEVRLFPRALPDGRHYLFTSRNVAGLGQGVYVGTLDSLDARRVSDAWSPAAYASGHLLFVRQTTLFAQPFDLANLTLSGEPHRVADRIGLGYGNPLTFAFSVSSAGGIIAYWTGTKNPETQLAWFDRSGMRIATAGEAAAHFGFSLSFDARRAVLERMQASSSTIDLWLLDMANPVGSSRLTLDGRSSSPIWAPDGQRLLVMQRDVGLFLLPTEGAGGVAIAASQSVNWPADWSSDGRILAFTTTTADGSQLWTTRAEQGSRPALYRQAPFVLASMQFSPDGRWIAYVSDESGQREVYVDSYPTPRSKLRISTGGGGWPKWRRDGKELYYLAPDRKVMVVAVQESPAAISVEVPRALFEGPAVLPDETRGQFSPNLDGTRFLFNARVDNRRPVGLDVIANWPALLDGR
jgi:Tol biopolymer transport system component